MDKTSTAPRTIFLLLLALLVALGMFLLATNSPDWSLVELPPVHANGHANQTHPKVADLVRDCFKKYGSLHIFYNPNTQRYLEVCFMEDGKYGIRISEYINEKLEEITAFQKEKFSTWKQMSRYIENGGYTNQVK
jgi:hypothetical protein